MNNPHFLVLFHQVNYALAASMTRDLVHAGFAFSLLCEDDLGPGETLSDRIRADHRPLLILISDNFLRTSSCVHGLLPILKDRDGLPIQIIVLADGMTEPDKTPVTTRLDRVGQILQYINHWQDRYLKLRRQQAERPTITAEQETELRWTRQIAFEIGDLIEYFRESNTYSWEAFCANQYEVFFRKSGNISLHQEFKDRLPYMEDDRELEDRLRDDQPLGGPAPEGTSFNGDQESVATSVEPGVPEQDGPEKDLLSKLIAYKNGLGSENDSPEEPLSLESPSDEDDGADDWDDDDDQEDGPLDRYAIAGHATAGIVPLHTRDVAGLRKLLEADPENNLVRLELAALLAQDEEHFNETTTLLEDVLRQDPQNARAFLLLGRLSREYREFKLARRYFEKALENDPELGEAQLDLARLLVDEHGHGPDSLELLVQARKTLPGDAGLWELLAEAYVEDDQPRKAVKALKKVLKLMPQRTDLKVRIAELYQSLGEKDKALRYASSEPVPPTPPVAPSVPHVPKEDSTPRIPVDTSAEEKRTAVPEGGERRTVLITGATSGIGRATARLFAAKGYRLILTGRREDRLSALQAELEQRYHATIFPMAFDIRQEAVTRQLIRALPREWSTIDVLVNNAGLAKGLAPIHEGKVEDWDTMIDTNIKGLLYMTRAVVPGMVTRGTGHVINVCSTAGKETYPKGNVYCATKFAVDALTQSMRQDLVPFNIRVGQVSPGHVEETEFALNRFDGDKERARIYEDFNPLKASDVAEAIWFMVSQPAHVNIQDILLMGTQQAGNRQIERSGRIFDL